MCLECIFRCSWMSCSININYINEFGMFWSSFFFFFFASVFMSQFMNCWHDVKRYIILWDGLIFNLILSVLHHNLKLSLGTLTWFTPLVSIIINDLVE